MWWGFLRDVWTGRFFHDRLTVLQLRSFSWKVSLLNRFPYLDTGLIGDSRATPIIMYVHVPQPAWHEHNSCSRVEQASLNTAEAQESLPLGLDIHYTCAQLLETVLMEWIPMCSPIKERRFSHGATSYQVQIRTFKYWNIFEKILVVEFISITVTVSFE